MGRLFESAWSEGTRKTQASRAYRTPCIPVTIFT